MSKTKEKLRPYIIGLAMLFILFFRFIPAPQGMTTEGMQVLGIFIAMIILWMTISIDWPSMLCILAVAFVPGLKMSSILSASVGSATFSFLMFTFMCTYTLGQTPFVRRCAVAFITGKMASRGQWSFVIFYFASIIFLGSFMSPTVLVVIYITITEEIFSVLGLNKKSPIANMMMTGMVFCSGIAAGMTPVAHVFPLISMGVYQAQTGQAISYASYMAAGIPVGLIVTALMLLAFRFVLRPDMAELTAPDVKALRAGIKPMEKKEKLVLAVFALVVALWILPGVIKPWLPGLSAFIDGFGSAMPPLLGAVLLAIITAEGKPLLDFKEAMSKGVPWASLIMVSGTLALGAAMTDQGVGLTAWISGRIEPLALGMPTAALVILFIAWSALQTNLSSNMVTATVVTTVAMPVLQAVGGGISAPALVSLIGMMSAYAFATPPAMATVAFAIGSGWTTTGFVAKYGAITMIIGIIIAALIGYPIAALVM